MHARTLVALAPVALLGVGGAGAAAQSASLTGVTDFQISTVGEGLGGFLPETIRRNATDSRFQVNGRDPNPADRNFGLWTTFDLDFDGLFAGPVAELQSVTVDLFQAQPITGQDINNVIDGGTLNLYYTTEDADVLDAGNGFDWIDADPEGLGSQFSDRVLVGSVDLVAGNTDVSFDVDLTSIESSLLSAINADGFGRFVLTSPTPQFASSWGVGEPGTSDIQAFDGPAPVVTFTVPTPGAGAMLALAGVAGVRRRRG
jgi:MYXO-CTERM domain-containing protein